MSAESVWLDRLPREILDRISVYTTHGRSNNASALPLAQTSVPLLHSVHRTFVTPVLIRPDQEETEWIEYCIDEVVYVEARYASVQSEQVFRRLNVESAKLGEDNKLFVQLKQAWWLKQVQIEIWTGVDIKLLVDTLEGLPQLKKVTLEGTLSDGARTDYLLRRLCIWGRGNVEGLDLSGLRIHKYVLEDWYDYLPECTCLGLIAETGSLWMRFKKFKMCVYEMDEKDICMLGKSVVKIVGEQCLQFEGNINMMAKLTGLNELRVKVNVEEAKEVLKALQELNLKKLKVVWKGGVVESGVVYKLLALRIGDLEVVGGGGEEEEWREGVLKWRGERIHVQSKGGIGVLQGVVEGVREVKEVAIHCLQGWHKDKVQWLCMRMEKLPYISLVHMDLLKRDTVGAVIAV